MIGCYLRWFTLCGGSLILVVCYFVSGDCWIVVCGLGGLRLYCLLCVWSFWFFFCVCWLVCGCFDLVVSTFGLGFSCLVCLFCYVYWYLCFGFLVVARVFGGFTCNSVVYFGVLLTGVCDFDWWYSNSVALDLCFCVYLIFIYFGDLLC